MKINIIDLQNLDKEKIDKVSIDTINKIRNFIENKTDDFLKMNSSELAEHLDLSQSTISRFAKGLGFKSYSDFKIYVSKRLQLKQDTYDDNIDNSNINSINQVSNNIKTHYIYSVQKTVERFIDSNDLMGYINTIRENKVNVIFAIGESGMVGRYFSWSIRKIGFNTIFVDNIHSFFGYSSLITSYKKTHVTIISKSRKTLEVKNIINFLIKNNVTYSIWTKNTKIKPENCKNILLLESIEQNYRISHIGSKISAFLISDIIFSYLSSVIDQKKIIFKEINNQIKEWNSLLPDMEQKEEN
ncbi:MurR/RpiR family transcriptional regulator [Mycoplasma sp. CSL7491-lung]|uniref:MurR/RpiR family transcriptional regulator n=1 Tax=Mycoplasma sp. CSL7491-lung TaxID=549718 RepID=UPI001C12072E|nr:MurR/RpiR family transcriptional regulator [Mycoplasma sp. CSL7491-lung]MBU4693088.1 MurR/RpiR family transcriptional regulator [Mycoplasma sp. CSL7491-lung]